MDFRVGSKLGASFGIMGVIFCGVVGLYHNTLVSTEEAYEKVINDTQQKKIHTLNIDSAMLQARRSEKDFLLRLNTKYVDRVAQQVDKVKAEAQALKSKEKASGNGAGEQAADKVIANIGVYHDSFKSLVAAWEKKGLTPKTGLQGTSAKRPMSWKNSSTILILRN